MRRRRGRAVFASAAHAHFQFLDDSVFGLAAVALNYRVPSVHMPVCAVYTTHRRMCVCVQRSRGTNDARCRPSKEPAVARTLLFTDSR